MEKLFPRELGSLDAITEFVHGFFDQAGIAESNSFRANLIIEELFTNAVRHSPGGQEVAIGLEREGNALVIRVTDRGVEPFDIRQVPDPDTTLPLYMRRGGGLGLHFIRKMAEEITYQHQDRSSTITVRTRLED